MKLSESFFYTLREDVKEEDCKSSNLLVRSSMIKKMSSGMYSFMPLGYKVLDKIRNVIKDEMNKVGCQEILMPSLISTDVYDKSGRSSKFGDSVFSVQDKFNRKYTLAPTHEELFAIASKLGVKSYKNLPFNLYQFQTKFRDETRPRFGLVRVREFIMKDSYSFDKDLEGLDISYNKMYKAYQDIFERLDVNYAVVTADTGVMGGLLSEEFQAITDIGEDTVVLCDKCDFSSNIEVSPCLFEDKEDNSKLESLEKVETKDMKTIEEVSNFLNVDKSNILKCVIYKCDEEFVACFVRGDKEVNEVKLSKILNLETEPVIVENGNLKDIAFGFVGPIDLNIKCIADKDVLNMRNFVVGANCKDMHYISCNFERDFSCETFDISNIREGDICPNCKQGKIYFKKGIEIGNTFKLGTKYSEAFDLNFSDENNLLKPVVMGSYGIGLGRLMAAIAEQKADDNGLVWPKEIAPFLANIIVVNNKDEVSMNLANELYNEFKNLCIDVMLDDRKERVGVKFKDSDLIGIPVRIIVGRKASENIVEFKLREDAEAIELTIEEVINKIKNI